MFKSAKDNFLEVQNVLVDGGNKGEKFTATVDEILGATVEVVKRNELHQFVVLPKRWIVKHSFSRLEKYRRLWKNCERLINAQTTPNLINCVEA